MSGYRQKTKKYSVQIDKKIDLDFEKIDDWLFSVLKLDVEYMDEATQIHKLASRILLLSKTLLQALKIPVFHTGAIADVTVTQSDKCIITLEIVHIEHIPQETYLSVVNNVINLLIHFMPKDVSDENINALFSMIDSKLLRPLHNCAGSGKSTMPILQKAYEMNIPFTHLSNGIYRLGWGSKARRLNRSVIDKDSAIGSQMAQNKVVTAMLLRSLGLPASQHTLAASKNDALAGAQNLGWPVVVKPMDKDRGEGITIDIANEKQLYEAFEIARDASQRSQVIIEKQVKGVCCRVFIVGDKMLYAVKRLPLSVVGDGKKTVEELIEEANQKEKKRLPWLREKVYFKDSLALEAIENTGYTLQTVAKDEELIPLRKFETTSWGGFDEDVSEIIHPENINIALRAAKLFDLNVAGIDIITEDISVPWYENAAIINEVNYSPLLGGGEISKSKISAYLRELIHDDGRIPIIAVIGENSFSKALQIQKEKCLNTQNCFITSNDKSYDAQGNKIHLTAKTLNERLEALLFDKRLEKLILVVENDEVLYLGLAVDKVDAIIIESNNLLSYKNSYNFVTHERYNQVESFFRTLQSSACVRGDI